MKAQGERFLRIKKGGLYLRCTLSVIVARLPMGTARLVATQVKFFPVSVSMGRIGRKLRVVTRFLSGSSS